MVVRWRLGRGDDWVFHPQSDGYLLTPRGAVWTAVSGGNFSHRPRDKNRGACPFGWFRIGRPSNRENAAWFLDGRRNCWFCPITYNYSRGTPRFRRHERLDPVRWLRDHGVDLIRPT